MDAMDELDSEREKPELDCAAACVHAVRRFRMLPTLSRDGNGGGAARVWVVLLPGEKAGRPCPSPSLLRLGPAATLAYELRRGISGGGIAPSPFSPFRGGRAGGSDEDAVIGPPSSLAGDFDLEREMLFPLARRSQDGLDFGAGLMLASVRSELDAREGEDAREESAAGVSGTGFVTSA